MMGALLRPSPWFGPRGGVRESASPRVRARSRTLAQAHGKNDGYHLLL